jgi:phosphoglycerate-specific signal transduction histidine kinase
MQIILNAQPTLLEYKKKFKQENLYFPIFLMNVLSVTGENVQLEWVIINVKFF